jgi:antagonist of KipI
MRLQKIGICTSIQDLGRQNKYESGLNSSGALDVFSFKKVNLILENPISEATLECFYPAAEIVFDENGILAISGGDFGAELNERKLLNNRQYAFYAGDILRFKKKISGNIIYIGFKGGIDLPIFENSKCTDKGLNFNVLNKDSYLNLIQENASFDLNFGISELRASNTKNFSVVLKDVLDLENNALFLNNEAEIQMNSNRMGFRVKFRDKIEIKAKSQISSFVGPGSVQILPSGDAIILMADAQVTGGYPVIGFVSKIDLYRLSQVSIGEKITFTSISLNEARTKISEQEIELEQIKKNIELWKSIVT